MKKGFKNLLMLAAIVLGTASFIGCSDSKHGGNKIPVVDPVTPTNTSGMINQTLAGIVRDTEGNPVEGVQVKSGAAVSQTNSAGVFTFSTVLANSGRIIVNFEKTGYFSVTRACDKSQTGNWDVVIVPKSGSDITDSKAFGAGTKGTLDVAAGMKVELPAGGFKDEASGSNYTGTVNADMAYLSPDDKNFADMMPGSDLIAVGEEGPDAQLLSYGMIAVNLTDDYGNKLNLQEGQKATVTFPIPAVYAGASIPNEIPLWSFNEQTGKWEKDGVAKRQGDVYVGQVSHFSWWNLDYPMQQGVISGTVKDTNGNPLPNLVVHVGQITTRTDKDGKYTQKVVANENFDVWVEGLDYNNTTDRLDVKTLNVQPYEELNNIDLVLPATKIVRGTVKNADGTVPIVALYFEYGGQKTASFVNNTDGTYFKYLPSDFTGTAKLVGISASGREQSVNFTVDGTKQEYIVNLTFTGTPSSNQLLVTLDDGSKFSIDLSKVTAEVNAEWIYVNKESDATGSFNLGAEVDKDGSTRYIYAGFGLNDGAQYYVNDLTVNTFSYDDNNVTFQITGRGTKYGSSSASQSGTVQTYIFETGKIQAPITRLQKKYYNVLPKSVGFPDFTPQLDTPSPMVLLTIKGPNGKGGQVTYLGGQSEFDQLVKQAAASGISLKEEKSFEVQGWYGDEPQPGTMTYKIYYSNNKFIYVGYDSTQQVSDDDEELEWRLFEGMVPIQVVVWDNLTDFEAWSDGIRVREQY